VTGTIFNKQTQLLAYADDIDIVGRTLEAVRDAYLALETGVAKIELKIDEQNTKYMIAAENRTIIIVNNYRRQTNWLLAKGF
jgi:hypothetical protein